MMGMSSVLTRTTLLTATLLERAVQSLVDWKYWYRFKLSLVLIWVPGTRSHEDRAREVTLRFVYGRLVPEV
jgi:hypothetical protein